MDKRHDQSQYGQSQVIAKLVEETSTSPRAQRKGKFIEAGAWDGAIISNTYYLEKVLDWTGILVEPIAKKAEQIPHNRWCDLFQGCIYNRDGHADFLHIEGYSEMLSGIAEAYHEKMKERIYREMKGENQTSTTLKVHCKTINGLLETKGWPGVDYLSLDTLTSELEILKAYDPKKHPIKVISLDTNGCNSEELELWFKSNGYEQYWKHAQADEYVYVNPKIKWSWE